MFGRENVASLFLFCLFFIQRQQCITLFFVDVYEDIASSVSCRHSFWSSNVKSINECDCDLGALHWRQQTHHPDAVIEHGQYSL